MAEKEGRISIFGGDCVEVCPVCEGSGRVTVTRDITVTVESYQE